MSLHAFRRSSQRQVEVGVMQVELVKVVMVEVATMEMTVARRSS